VCEREGSKRMGSQREWVKREKGGKNEEEMVIWS